MRPTDVREHRLSDDYPDQAKDPRQPFQIDRDRILYSNAFRRLAGVTQVVSPGEGEIFHNRLTHSLKVAQIARRMAETFLRLQPKQVAAWGGINPDVCEAAALAHDLGHPPFGHVAEYELQRLVSGALAPPKKKGAKGTSATSVEGYEGNAQSFRIVTELSVRRPQSRHGLDLTRATLNATLKYPWVCGENPDNPKKYGAFECDREAFTFAREGDIGPLQRSLEAQIMDWADDITYSVHDTEDFYRAGLLPLDRLASNPTEQDRFRASIRARNANRDKPLEMNGDFDAVFSGLFDNIRVRDRYEGGRRQQEELYAFVAGKIAEYVRATKLLDPPGRAGEALEVPSSLRKEVALMKELTWTYVIENPALAAHQYGQRKAIVKLFEVFDEEGVEGRWTLFPSFYRERGEGLVKKHGSNAVPVAERVRLVADTIASMTDRQALIVYQQLTGVSPSSMLDPVA